MAVAASSDRKHEIIDTFCQERRHVAMLGDGINDAAALAAADVGMAMGQGRMWEFEVASISSLKTGPLLALAALDLACHRSRMLTQGLF